MSKIEAFWENATADDVAEIIKTGTPIPARVRNEDGDSWRDDTFLWGWINGNWAARGAYWTHCQVYREPSWFTSKPDPGPGWRLLEKFPPEAKLGTDDYWSILGEEWRPVGSGDNDQHEEIWYRRRIEPVEVVEPDVLHYVLLAGESAKLPNGQTITATEKGFEVTQ